MNTCTMYEVYQDDNPYDLIGYHITDWDGKEELETWDGYAVVVKDGVIVEVLGF